MLDRLVASDAPYDSTIFPLLESGLRVLTDAQIRALREALEGRALALCFGAGVDSTAMLVVLRAAGLRPTWISFANVGAEKPETLAHIPRTNAVLKRWGWPLITEVKHQTLPSTPYSDLEGNCLENETLPSLAFGMKSCSIKWKHKPQDQLLMGAESGPNARPPDPLWAALTARGERVVKLIGYDSGKADMRRSKNLANADAHFDFAYPLQIIGWERKDCVRAITQALGPEMVPIKSACFFCPASKAWELWWLAGTHPDLFERALHLERVALTGRHSRFDKVEFGDTWENLVANAERFPSSKTTVGLGRKFAWNHWARINQVVDDHFRVRRQDRARFLAMAAQLGGGEDNALDMRACA